MPVPGFRSYGILSASEVGGLKSREQSAVEEIANTVTHGIGLALSVAGLVLLVVSAATRGDALRVTTLAIFGSALIVAYGASTLYHAFRHPAAKRVFRILDHASIYLLILSLIHI